jgi:transcriptional regulator with XRE-family HTH domain
VSIDLSVFIDKNPFLTPITDGVSSRVTSGRKNPLWFGFAKRLLRTREAAGLSVLAASKLAGMSHSGWRFVEIEQCVPCINTVEKIALSLGVAPCWLGFGNDGEEPFQQKIPRLGSDDPSAPSPEPEKVIQATAYMGFPARLTNARKAKDISMRELSRRADMSVNAVSLLEGGKTIPRVDNCEALALALDVAPCWLAFGVGRGPALN